MSTIARDIARRAVVTEGARRAVNMWGAQQKTDELAQFGQFVLDEGCRSLLEIGTYNGGTARFFAALGLDVTAVDCDLRQVVRSVPLGEALDVTFVEGYSGPLAKSFKPGQFDVVFIDGDHSLAGVTADWEAYRLVARKLVAFHDIVEHPPQLGCEVDQLWQQLQVWREGTRLHEIVSDDGVAWAGIGVVLI